MVYKRSNRPTFYFEAKQRVGYKQLCTDTTDKKTAQRIEHVWSTLADQRAWDLLEPIVADLAKPKSERARTIGWLLDVWNETRGDLAAIRRRAADVDVEPFVAEWFGTYEGNVEPDSASHALAHVRHFFPEGTPRMVSAVTPDWLLSTLTGYAGKRNTRRKVHSSLSVFLEYCTKVKKLFANNPMLGVDRPPAQYVPPKFYDAATVLRIVEWQPDDVRAAYFALVYGTGADVSPALLVDKGEINPATHEVRIVGTKSDTRDRVVRVSDAMWPTFWRHAKTVLTGPVFPREWSRWSVSDWHRQTIGVGVKDTHGAIERAGLRLARQFALRNARHHFAVRLLQAGAPVRVVADQLGSDERTVLKHYGPWVTSAEDRAKWEKIAARHESRRRKAETGPDTAKDTARDTDADPDGKSARSANS